MEGRFDYQFGGNTQESLARVKCKSLMIHNKLEEVIGTSLVWKPGPARATNEKIAMSSIYLRLWRYIVAVNSLTGI